MAKKKITLALRNTDRLKRAVDALGCGAGDLVDKMLDPLLDALEEDVSREEAAAAARQTRMAQTVDHFASPPRMIKGNSIVRDALEKSRAGKEDEDV